MATTRELAEEITDLYYSFVSYILEIMHLFAGCGPR